MTNFRPHLSLVALLAATAVILGTACTTTPTATSAAPAAGTGPGGAAAVATAVTAPVAGNEESRGRDIKLYTRPPNRLYGLILEQGSLDAVPDVAPMIEYQQQRMKARSLLKAAPIWEQIGPDTNLGRVIDIAFHPQNASIIYVSSPGGGVYKSTNAGISWTRLTALPYQPVNSIAIDPLNPNTVYFATGHYAQSGADLLALGIYKSTDGGATMSLLPATVPATTNTDWLRVTRLTVHPTIPNRLLASAFAGFFVSADGGATWTKVSSLPTLDFAIDPNDPMRVVRSRYDGAVSVSEDAGSTWATVSVVSATDVRLRAKFAKATPGIVYASVDQNEGEIHKSTDGGLTWAKVSTPAHLGTQGFHTNQVWVSPTDSNHLIIGGVDLFRSINGGATFTKISNWQSNSTQTMSGITPTTPHADQNAAVSPPSYSEANPVVFVGTDGGLFSTANARTVTINQWTKNGGNLSLTQFVGAAGKRSGGIDTLVGGTQDNGTLLNVGYQGWQNIAGGDGGNVVFDPTESYIFGEFQNGVVFRYGPAGFRNICAGILDADPDDCGSAALLNTNFYAPIEIDSSGRLYMGGNSLWRTTNPKSTPPIWTSIKPGLATGTAVCSASGQINCISAIAIQASNPAFALVGHSNGRIFRSLNLTAATPTWQSLTSSVLPASRAIGSIYIDPEDANRIYVGYNGYFANNLWRTDDGGATWINISAGLPPGSIYTITRHPLTKDRVFVGTIWGSYGSENAGQTWPTVHDGPAPTAIKRLFWLGNDTLVAATFGNGMFRGTVGPFVTLPNTVVEYYHPVLDNYFITADPVEQAAVDSGAAGAEWRRTGGTFKAGGPNRVCRFYGNARPNPATGAIFGPNSHFYTADTPECEGLKAAQNPNAKSWFFESNDFNTTSAVNRACPAGLVPVYRAYNNGFARNIDSNHRITPNLAAIQEVVARGWNNEGIVMCAPAS